ncbi:beta-glucosidase M [Fusarium acutatum]|uniref:beta-glucosidase n=1 Tax=Fusarium acutatum TaxID=78861 RepID=A0A8H4J9R8_9HYPO|nr:beta-glucosidase M [Fusarium acutatum]
MALSIISISFAVLQWSTGVAAQHVIYNDTFFNDHSPPVYPSPLMTGTGPWEASYGKALVLVNLTSGIQGDTGCSGTIPAIPRLGFPGLCLSDAGNGVRNSDFVSSWPSGLHVGASWNKDLAGMRGSGMAGEFKAKGVNVLLGPVAGPLGRVVRGGRNWEGFAVDPYLSGVLTAETVTAVQKVGVMASTKAVSSNIDDQTMHELYLWPFQDAVRAGTTNIMCSYQRVNNSYGCANSKTQNGLLKGELGFQGFVVSDWTAQHAGVATALAGMDMVMPFEGHVLVKNVNQALPLKAPKMLTIYGYSAKNPDQNGYAPFPGAQGISLWSFGLGSVGDSINAFTAMIGGSANPADIAPNGTIVSGGGSGATSQSLIISPFDSLVQKAYEDNTRLFWDFSEFPMAPNPETDACLWIDHPNVTALIFGHLPGQDSGKALVDILYGKVNPSGKLPYTVLKNESDYGHLLDPDVPKGSYLNVPQSNFTEGVYVDYRHFDKLNIEPRYEFGFGLSYTTYKYSNLKIEKLSGAKITAYSTGPVMEGGQTDLWDTLVKVTADVTNAGQMDGAEAAQLYVGIPGAPLKQLRGFKKPFIKAGKTTRVHFELTSRDLSVWDTVIQKWLLQSGDYVIFVGASSRILPLEGQLKIEVARLVERSKMCILG